MPLIVDVSKTAKHLSGGGTSGQEQWDIGVTLMVAGFRDLTEDNFDAFCWRTLLIYGDPNISLSAIQDMYRPYIGTHTNNSPISATAFLANQRHKFAGPTGEALKRAAKKKA